MEQHTPTAVDLRGVHAAHGSTAVLHDVRAAIPAGRVTAVVGPNGSGKSTLLGVLAGVHAPSSGTVARFHTGRPALVVQHSAVPDTLPVTVADTVAMGRWAHRGPWRRLTAEDRAIVAECMARLGIADLARRRLGSLSGGQRQRALLAQGLAQQSDLLLLDEPSTGLDTAAQQAVLDTVAALRDEGVTVVHATHDPAVARGADHVLRLRQGRLVPEAESAPALG
ncbi:zinc ABC transporter ATP-binding protein AztA [Streptomonospora nanhaiensis]|uniref:Zinc/manganese transport system ATP-binding protein n=1 Tax=Streptomonospora nanhaiensis TaxID=1323731 RepID=A0A853BVN5_9ACTN|nr:zinc ABC transporter ATP-binding protein AztA [Streptomonospora nanhaiensis]MBX9390191.1 metal ABC transporter ATP-binding protein [Streptomonospora nanhaiensis]NYI99094.1 zinc/manganese transport system ATP-binding protein [Streptomonospora nanhaiensis]